MPDTTPSTVVNVLPATTKRSYQHLIAAAIPALGALIEALKTYLPEFVKYWPSAAKLGPPLMLAGFLYSVYLRQREPTKTQPVDLSPKGAVEVQATQESVKP